MYRVMLADDEPIMRKALVTLVNWKELDCNIVFVAVNGLEVMEQLGMCAPDILITDIRMPGKNGVELAKYIWEQKLPTKVIMLTAYADFSYAQSAVKYNVVDYVTKTGAFEGLISAVEQAKELIHQKEEKEESEHQDARAEIFFKSLFDGSLYDTEEIRLTSEKLSIHIKEYAILLLQFHLEDTMDVQRKKQICTSLLNFFSMVFQEQMLVGIPVERDMFAIVVNCIEENFQDEMCCKCKEIIDMMDNFMKLNVYIGISDRKTMPDEMKTAYEQAEFALESSFLDDVSKINFYQAEQGRQESYPPMIDKQAEALYYELMKGSKEKAIAVFGEIAALQREYKCSANMIKNLGILIQNKCRKALAEYDKTIYEITEIEGSISKRIYACRQINEYVKLMEILIEKTADFIHMAVNKKKSLIYDCIKYIDENYEKCIMVSDIAESIGASPSYLSRIFKEATGQTIIYTMNMKKVTKAKEYLENKEMKIYEIAEALGFENATYFSHFFKKNTGISPKDYRGEQEV